MKYKWTCIEGCGSCCKLDPLQRTEALAMLDESQAELYLSMVGDDGWCKHLDKIKMRCKIYELSPSFCKISYLDSNTPVKIIVQIKFHR